MKKYIYKITNIVNNKCYIGQAKNYEKRFKQHISALRKNKHENRFLQFSWNKYGEENFKFEVLDYLEDYNNQEKHYIELFNSTDRNCGYNILPCGENPPIGSRHTLSEEDVEKIKELLIDQKSFQYISEQFPYVTKGQIQKINAGHSWNDKTLQYPLKKYGDSEVGNEIANNIMDDLLNSFLTQKEIAKKYNVSRTCVTAINQGKVEKYYNPLYEYPLRSGKMCGNICDNPEMIGAIINDLINTGISIKDISDKYQSHWL